MSGSAVVLVTGANGFVGSAVMARLASESGFVVRGAVRGPVQHKLADSLGGYVMAPDLEAEADWLPALQGVHLVVHAAARVHVMNDDVADPLAEYRRTNVEGTLKLARQAAEAGVRRFVFLSSVKVNGESTDGRSPFSSEDEPAPLDPYGISKWEAERRLMTLADETGMEVVVIRPPLVYGPGVKGNFAVMIRWLKRGLPLPFGAVHNRRSLVALDNLVDLIVTCLAHSEAANRVFMVSDGADLSTPELLRRLGRAMGVPVRLLPVPPIMLEWSAALLGRRAVVRRLLGSLQVDIAKTSEVLGWKPPTSVGEGLRQAVVSSHRPEAMES